MYNYMLRYMDPMQGPAKWQYSYVRAHLFPLNMCIGNPVTIVQFQYAKKTVLLNNSNTQNTTNA